MDAMENERILGYDQHSQANSLGISILSEEHANTDTNSRESKKRTQLISRSIDHYGLTISSTPQEEVVYKVVAQPYHHPTRALFIGNIRKPIDALRFQNHLRVLVRQMHSTYKVDRAWMNRSRTHAIVLTNSLDAARVIRKELNGAEYPPQGERAEFLRVACKMELALLKESGSFAANGCDQQAIMQHKLFVDYISLSQIGEWIFEEDHGPKDAIWKVNYRRQGEHGKVSAEHTLLQGEFRPLYFGNEKTTAKILWKDNRTGNYLPSQNFSSSSELRDEYEEAGSAGRRNYLRTMKRRRRSRSPEYKE